MDIKLIKSKINLIEAQIKQFTESGLFDEKAIDKLIEPLKAELAVLQLQYDELLSKQRPEDFDVVAPQVVS